MPELLFELRSEEIPAGAQSPAAQELRRLLDEGLAEARIPAVSIDAWWTPRRITVRAAGVPDASPASRTERRGPRVEAPASAIEGFCRANRVSRGDLEIRELPKGRFYFAVIDEPARNAADLLREVLPAVAGRLAWRKSMRWGAEDLRWVRPLRGILCVFDGEPVSFELGRIASGASTVGHRFHAPDPFAVQSFADYRDGLRARHVVLDPDERRKRIHDDAVAVARAAGYGVASDDGLLEELTGLTEWPVVLLGSFDESFLSLPAEVLTTTMRRHQRYLPLIRDDGAPAPAFLMVANVDAHDRGAAVIAGNERVLRARLQDAAFFWDGDQKTALADRLDGLGGIIFHVKLGSMEDKARRLETLARKLCLRLGMPDEETVACAARLAKTDLVTDLVGEFPELQGVIGGHLARTEGLGEDVASAIAQHYRPLGPTDACPTAPVASLVALVDKLDTLVGFFWQGIRPTGSGDPFALRRAALGIIRIALENDLRLPVDHMLHDAMAVHVNGGARDLDPETFGQERDELRAFLKERLRVYLRASGSRHDHVAATLDARSDVFRDLPGLAKRVAILSEYLGAAAGIALQALYRRAANIVRIESRKSDTDWYGEVDTAQFTESGESDLYESLQACGGQSLERVRADDFLGALEELSRLREPIDRFFDSVRVNADDEGVRVNRLRLLASLQRTIDQAADFSKLEGGESGRHD